jgi:hypothetical protein
MWGYEWVITPFRGSLPARGVQVSDIVGVVPTHDSRGYWIVGSDGGVFAFGDAGFMGSLPALGRALHHPIESVHDLIVWVTNHRAPDRQRQAVLLRHQGALLQSD